MIGDPLEAPGGGAGHEQEQPGGGAGHEQEQNPNHGIYPFLQNRPEYTFSSANLLLFLFQQAPLLIFWSEDQSATSQFLLQGALLKFQLNFTHRSQH